MEFSRKTTCGVIAVLLFLFSALAVEGRRRFGDDDGGWITVNGGRFELNGSPFLFNGFNAYWLMHVAADAGQRGKVTEVLREASAAGLSVCRTWAFADGGDPSDLQTSPGVYNERVFQGLDFVISEARKFGVRLILNLVNNYNDFGGRPQYANWARNAGEQIAGDDDFYTNPVIKGYYKNHVMTVLTRMNTNNGIAYKDDPTIMAWELINEPRCASDLSGNTVNGWIAEMASYAKSVDNKHLVGTGLEGFYGDTMPERKQYNPGYTVGTDFIAAHQVPDVDFASIHAYTDQCGGDDAMVEDNNPGTNKTKMWESTAIVDRDKCRMVSMPECFNAKLDVEMDFVKVARLLYTNSGVGILALSSNGIQRLWTWPNNEQNPTGKATANSIPQHWQPSSGLLMINDVLGVNFEEVVPCIDLSKNDSYVVSAAGGMISLFHTKTFQVYAKLIEGHDKHITGLAFSTTHPNMLVSSSADAQLCVWNIVGRTQNRRSVYLQSSDGDEVCSGCLSAPISSATYSCNSQLAYASFIDGNIGIFDADNLTLRCRIAPSAYLSQAVLDSEVVGVVYAVVIAAHPQEPNQLAIGLTDGSIKVIEPLESEGEWEISPLEILNGKEGEDVEGKNHLMKGQGVEVGMSKHNDSALAGNLVYGKEKISSHSVPAGRCVQVFLYMADGQTKSFFYPFCGVHEELKTFLSDISLANTKGGEFKAEPHLSFVEGTRDIAVLEAMLESGKREGGLGPS
nr:mannan endo-1,4-beta-mannosidase 1-like [Ipomoea batatas]